MKELARSYLWWPNIDSDIESYVRSCDSCQSIRPDPPRAPLHPWEMPRAAWERIHVDYAGPVDGKMLFIVVDTYSKWLDVAHSELGLHICYHYITSEENVLDPWSSIHLGVRQWASIHE